MEGILARLLPFKVILKKTHFIYKTRRSIHYDAELGKKNMDNKEVRITTLPDFIDSFFEGGGGGTVIDHVLNCIAQGETLQ